ECVSGYAPRRSDAVLVRQISGIRRRVTSEYTEQLPVGFLELGHATDGAFTPVWLAPAPIFFQPAHLDVNDKTAAGHTFIGVYRVKNASLRLQIDRRRGDDLLAKRRQLQLPGLRRRRPRRTSRPAPMFFVAFKPDERPPCRGDPRKMPCRLGGHQGGPDMTA